MIVFRDAVRQVDTRSELSRCQREFARQLRRKIPDHAASVALLIDFGILEAALTDALLPDRDDLTPLTEPLTDLALASGQLFRAAWLRRPATHIPKAIERAFTQLHDAPLPRRLTLRTPEGYAYYGLYPEGYLVAAERLAAPLDPARAVCLGLRGIGTSLSAVVAAALQSSGWQVERITLRPRGHPFDRRLCAGPWLRKRWRDWQDAHFFIIDEGPGLSGSSFCGVAAGLMGLGIPESRIAFFPSWDPAASQLRSPAAQFRWPRHRRLLPGKHLLQPATAEAVDFSAGSWRAHLLAHPHVWPAVQPHHERMKWLLPTDRPQLLKFVGLGRFGTHRLERAERLAAAGLTPPPLALENGLLRSAFVPGVPLSATPSPHPELLETTARYLNFLHSNYAASCPVPFEENLAMIAHNLADEAIDPARLMRWRTELGDTPTIAIDGRMLPHEWIKTGSGYIKADALDHHDDHFFPGNQEIGWDVAGTIEEFGWSESVAGEWAARVTRLCRDSRLSHRLPFYRFAYLAFRIGYARLSADALGDTADGRRFHRLWARYRRQLQANRARYL